MEVFAFQLSRDITMNDSFNFCAMCRLESGRSIFNRSLVSPFTNNMGQAAMRYQTKPRVLIRLFSSIPSRLQQTQEELFSYDVIGPPHDTELSVAACTIRVEVFSEPSRSPRFIRIHRTRYPKTGCCGAHIIELFPVKITCSPTRA